MHEESWGDIQASVPNSRNSPCDIDLISGFEKPEVVFHGIPQLPSLETRAACVNNNHDVFVVGGKDRVPISVEANIDQLRTGPIVPVGVCQSCVNN